MNYKHIKKFQNMKEIVPPNAIKIPKRSLYYIGNGMLISYVERPYRIIECERIEYGMVGEYAQNYYYFMYLDQLRSFFNYSEELVADSKFTELEAEIDYDIQLEMSVQDVIKRLRNFEVEFTTSQSRRMIDGEFSFFCNEILFEGYKLLFFSEDKEAVMTGFSYTFV